MIVKLGADDEVHRVPCAVRLGDKAPCGPGRAAGRPVLDPDDLLGQRV